MSRHRNLRQMVEEDYYDYDDEDDYYDDYETDDYPAPPPPPPPSRTAAHPNNNNNHRTYKPSATKATNHPPRGSTTVTAATHRSQTGPSAPPPKPPNTTPTRPVPNILLPSAQGSEKHHLTVVVCGHVDAGKSTITGRLLHHQEHGRRHHSNHTTTPTNFAWLLDDTPEERAHGITMDISTRSLSTPHYTVVLLDAPGHDDYVPHMITGTSLAEAALLVVDVQDYYQPQQQQQQQQQHSAITHHGAPPVQEHVTLAKGLGVEQLLVVVNKMDTVQWRQDAYQQVLARLVPFLARVGYEYHVDPQNGSPRATTQVRFVPASGMTGANLVDPCGPETQDWYQGPTLMEALDQFRPPSSHTGDTASSPAVARRSLLERPLRLIITDVAGETTKGVSIRAKVLQGWLQTSNESLTLLPIGDATKLTKLTSVPPLDHESPERNRYVVAGQVVEAVLTGVDAARVATGHVLVRTKEAAPPSIATRCQARIMLLEPMTRASAKSSSSSSHAMVPLIPGAQVLLHMHQLDVPCTVSKLLHTLQKDGVTVARERPRALTSHATAMVELTTSMPIVMEAFDDCPGMARFVLRRSGESIAVGRIEKVLQ